MTRAIPTIHGLWVLLSNFCFQKKANLQSVLEDEQMKNEFERVEYEKDRALMKTKLKQVEEYSECFG